MKYSTLVNKLKSPTFELPKSIHHDLLHGVIGLVTEAAELADALKKPMAYGTKLNMTNVKEEIGDCLFYLTLICNSIGTTLKEEMARNAAKLEARYGGLFTKEAATKRNLSKEEAALNG